MLLLDYPQVILDIEKNELNIAAGLQDRVIQTYGGLVFMDFKPNREILSSVDSHLHDLFNQHGLSFQFNSQRTSCYMPLNPSMLPEMYLLYNLLAGLLLSVFALSWSSWRIWQSALNCERALGEARPRAG